MSDNPMPVNPKFWDDTDKSTYGADDCANAARARAVSIIAGNFRRSPVCLLEIGFGLGFDLFDHFWSWIKVGKFKYTGYDASAEMVRHAQAQLNARLAADGPVPHIPVLKHGTLDSLKAKSADVVYAKAVFEHQPDFRPALRQAIKAAKKLIVINWYRPPAEKEVVDYSRDIDIFSITWRRADVEAVLTETKCQAWYTEPMPDPPHNELWVIRR